MNPESGSGSGLGGRVSCPEMHLRTGRYPDCVG